MPSDEELLASYVAGRAQDYDELVRRYGPAVYSFLVRFVGNPATAEDLVQDVFLQVHLAASSFDPQRRFRPWLFTIAANKARDHLRGRGRHATQSLDASQNPEQPSIAGQVESAGADVVEAMNESERAAAVRRQIAAMPEHLRIILIMGYYQQMPYAEIAEVLDIPVGTVKSRLHAAVQHFAKLWSTTPFFAANPSRP